MFFWNPYALLVFQAYFFRATCKLVIPAAVGQKTQRWPTGAFRELWGRPTRAKFENGCLRPKKGMTGRQIVKKYGVKNVIEGLCRFYSQGKWAGILQDFEDAVKFSRKNKL